MSKPTWEEVKAMDAGEARRKAQQIAPEGVDASDGEAFLSLAWFMAKKFFPELYEHDPKSALLVMLKGLVDTTMELPDEDIREIAENAAASVEQAKAMGKAVKAAASMMFTDNGTPN